MSVSNITLEVLTDICQALSNNDKQGVSNIIVAVIAGVGSLLGIVVTALLKMPQVKQVIPGLKNSAAQKKQLHDTIATVIPALQEVKSQLSSSQDSQSDKNKKPV